MSEREGGGEVEGDAFIPNYDSDTDLQGEPLGTPAFVPNDRKRLLTNSDKF